MLRKTHVKVRACRGRWELLRSNSALSVCESVNKVSVFAQRQLRDASGVLLLIALTKLCFYCVSCDSVALVLLPVDPHAVHLFGEHYIRGD